MLYELSIKNKQGNWELLDCAFSKKEMTDKLQNKVMEKMEATGVYKMDYKVVQCATEREQIEEGFIVTDDWFNRYFK